VIGVLIALSLLAQSPAMAAGAADAPASAATSALEGRPAAMETSPLQARVDAAEPGATIDVAPGIYRGDLVIDKPLHLAGHGQVQLVGSGAGSVVRVRADEVVVEGFDIDGREGGSLSRDSAGIHVSGHHVTIRHCHVRRAIFGIYLYAADDVVVDHVVVDGLRGRAPGEQGSGIHLWNTQRFTLADNVVRDSRDGIYIQSSSDGVAKGNDIADVRYGLHYMFSDRNTFEDNVFERSAAGAALMYSSDLVFRRNRFLRNRGFASVGLLMQGCERVIAEDNLIADNARGLFLEGVLRGVFRRNVIADSDAALVIYDSTRDSRFEGNVFVGNLAPLQLSGRRTDTVFDGNYWSDDTGADLDGDGVRDTPYRLSNVFDHLRGRLTAADLFAQGLGAAILASAEQRFPVLAPVPVVDAHPLARPPHLRDLPAMPRSPVTHDRAAMWLWAAVGAAAAAVFALARPSKAARMEAA
jgi:nitrous oxidase accessory protein